MFAYTVHDNAQLSTLNFQVQDGNRPKVTQEMAMKTAKTRASVAVAVNGWGKLFCVLCVLASFAARGAIDDPVAYWSFDEE